MLCEIQSEWVLFLAQIGVWLTCVILTAGWHNFAIFMAKRFTVVDDYLGQGKRLLLVTMLMFAVFFIIVTTPIACR